MTLTALPLDKVIGTLTQTDTGAGLLLAVELTQGLDSSILLVKQVGIDDQPINTTLPAEIITLDNTIFGVYSAALGNDILFSLDASNYGSFVFEVQQLSAGSLRVETSVDNVNRWTDLPAYNIDQIANPGWSAVISATGKYRVPGGAHYIRMRKISDGAAQVQVTGSQYAAPPAVIPGGSLPFTESTALLGVATFTGSRRTNNATQGGPGTRFRTFEAESYANLVGTLFIDKSIDAGVTWVEVNSITATATAGGGFVGRLSVPIFAPDYRVRYTNIASTQTSFILTSAYRT